jgi:hypothetical protein
VAVRFPDRLLPHTLTVVHPTVTLGIHNQQVRTYDAGTGTDIAAYVQPKLGAEFNEARQQSTIELRTYSVDHPGDALDRVVWRGRWYDVIGPTRAYETPDGHHHYEGSIRAVEG